MGSLDDPKNMNALLTRIGRVLRRAGHAKLPEPRAVAYRLLEETVELAIECGLGTGSIHAAVNDAITNEATKLNVLPSELVDQEPDYRPSPLALAGELADVKLLAGWCGRVGNVNPNAILNAAYEKIVRLEEAARAGELFVSADGRFYRRVRKGEPDAVHQ
jgi:hypothetical protein